MSGQRERFASAGRQLAADAFDAGVMAVIAAVYANKPLREVGIGGSLSEANMERIRCLRQKVHGTKALDYKAKRPKPPKWRPSESLGVAP